MRLHLVSDRFDLISGSAIVMQRPTALESGSFATTDGRVVEPGLSRPVEPAEIRHGVMQISVRAAGLYMVLCGDVSVGFRDSDSVIPNASLLVAALPIDADAITAGEVRYRLPQTTLATIKVKEAGAGPHRGVVQTTFADEGTIDLILSEGEIRLLLAPGSHQFFLDNPEFDSVEMVIPEEAPPLFQFGQFNK